MTFLMSSLAEEAVRVLQELPDSDRETVARAIINYAAQEDELWIEQRA